MNKDQTLRDAAEYRTREVFQHQINIDNYRLAIEEIELNYAGVEHMQEFAVRLRDLLQSSICEQDKEKVMLKVIKMQIGET